MTKVIIKDAVIQTRVNDEYYNIYWYKREWANVDTKWVERALLKGLSLLSIPETTNRISKTYTKDEAEELVVKYEEIWGEKFEFRIMKIVLEEYE